MQERQSTSAHYEVIVPSDTVALDPPPRALLVLTDGNIATKNDDGTTIGPHAFIAGQRLDIRPTFVMATGTTATLLGLW